MTSTKNITVATAERRIASVGSDPAKVLALAADVAGSFRSNVEGWQIVAARMAYAAHSANVVGKTNTKNPATESTEEYGNRFGVSRSRVSQWVHGGRVLSVAGDTAIGDVNRYLSKPGDYSVKALTEALDKGDKRALAIAEKAKKAEREEADRKRADDKVKAEKAEEKARLAAEKAKVTVDGGRVGVLLDLLAQITPAEVIEYGNTDETVALLRRFANDTEETFEAHRAEVADKVAKVKAPRGKAKPSTGTDQRVATPARVAAQDAARKARQAAAKGA